MKEIALSTLDNQQLFTLASRVETVIAKKDTAALGIKPYSDNFISKLGEYKTSFKKQAVSAEMIAQKDGVRDNFYIALRNHIRNHDYHPDADRREKAKKLMAVLNQHGNQIYAESYSVETAAIEAIIAEFDKNHLETLEALGATGWYNFLKNAQADFENAIHGISEQKAESAKVASATQVRSGLVDAMRKLFAFLPLHYGISKSPELAQLIGLLQAEADRF